ncbi:hypothetical protein Pint_01367 [Pistacia integerrima]|uniref:Uncharacterized protein n=1 Tax=Pistacia integerrima TaxID=434235 RepID=A0ACC0ZME6_9ROSI|nr:hypothetical protein Pint_01367 [Pistacia integerrima]
MHASVRGRACYLVMGTWEQTHDLWGLIKTSSIKFLDSCLQNSLSHAQQG